jgi:Ni/Fe-hydrogenase 1 B-type cytochrome subunit
MTPPTTTASAGGAQAQQIAKGEAFGRERVYVWDIVVRLSHWIIMITLLILAFTGIYIGHPFYIPSGATDTQFVMGTMKIVHFYAAIIFTLAVLARVWWMFAGPYYARWHQFVPLSRRRLRDVIGMFKFYTFLSREPPLNVGHNPLAGLTYLAVFTLYFVMILTGLALYSVDAGVSYMKMWSFLLPVFGGPQFARYIHHIAMWLLLGFFAHHIWSAILVSRVEGNGLIDSMFSGYKFLPRNWRNRDE